MTIQKQAGESGGRGRTKQASNFSAATDNNRIEWKNIQNIIKEGKAQGLLYRQMYNNYRNIVSMNISWEIYQKMIPDKQKEDTDVKTDVEH